MALGPLEEHDEDACRGRNHCTMCMLCVFTLLNRVTKCKGTSTDGEVSGTELHRKSRSQKLQHCSKATQHCTQEVVEQGMDRHTHRSSKAVSWPGVMDGSKSCKGMCSGGVRSSSSTSRQQMLISL